MAEIVPSVLVATPCHTGQVCLNYMESVLWLAHRVEFYWVNGESLITRARNDCVAHFLRGSWSDLFFVDSDIGFKRKDFDRIVASKYDVVAGAYAKKGDDAGMVPDRTAIGAPDEDGFAIAREVPTGFMRIKRKVLEEMRAKGTRPWQFFDVMATKEDDYLSEDYAFCRRWQALGGIVHLDTKASLTHQGNKLYRSKYDDLSS